MRFTLIMLVVAAIYGGNNICEGNIRFRKLATILALMRPAIIPIPLPIQKVSKSKPHVLIDAKPVHVPVPVHHHTSHHKATNVLHHNHASHFNNIVVAPKHIEAGWAGDAGWNEVGWKETDGWKDATSEFTAGGFGGRAEDSHGWEFFNGWH